jgi:hypothetical protein
VGALKAVTLRLAGGSSPKWGLAWLDVENQSTNAKVGGLEAVTGSRACGRCRACRQQRWALSCAVVCMFIIPKNH